MSATGGDQGSGEAKCLGNGVEQLGGGAATHAASNKHLPGVEEGGRVQGAGRGQAADREEGSRRGGKQLRGGPCLGAAGKKHTSVKHEGGGVKSTWGGQEGLRGCCRLAGYRGSECQNHCNSGRQNAKCSTE